MNRDSILAIIRRTGFFEINPLAYRDDKKRKVLKRLEKAGVLQSKLIRLDRRIYTISEKIQI